MNKKLVALAVAGVLAAPLAAQAQTANVTLYGRVNLDMELVRGERTAAAGGGNPSTFRVSSNSSRLGVRGTESLGGGLNAIFQIESNVSADSGNSGTGLGNRETFVGLQGAWGTVKMGNFLAPYDDIHPVFGNVPTLTTSILSTASLWSQGGQPKTSGGFDARLANSVRYDSPNYAGFTGGIQYSSWEGGAPSLKANSGIVSLGGFYNNGPIQVGVAYEQNNQIRGAGLTDKALSVAGGYNFGIVRLGGVWERLDYDTASGNLKRDFWGVGLTGNFGPGQLYAFVGLAYDGKGSAATGTRVGALAKGDDTGSTQWEISYTYPLSKRTLLYTGFVQIDNDKNANYTFNINPYPVANGAKPSGIVMGAVHFF
jgi:predicted porin